MSKINHHPRREWVDAYARGELFGSHALLVAAHVEFCPECRARVEAIEAEMAQQCFDLMPDSTDVAMTESLLSAIIPTLPETQLKPATVDAPTELQIEHRRFSLPKVLARQLKHLGDWSNLPGKLQQAKLQLDKGHCFFIHMDAEARVPQHTHHGDELTLVLHGGFADDHGEYKRGDFIHLDGSHKHQPFTDEDEDCLVISALDGPLHFTSGAAKLLNPLSQLFFR